MTRTEAVNAIMMACGQQRYAALPGRVSVSFSNGAWTHSSRQLSSTGAFTSYTFAAGDLIFVSGGTNVTPQWYEVGSRVSNDAVTIPSLTINGADATNVVVSGIRKYDSGIVGQVEYLLDIVTREVQAEGKLPDNVDYGVNVTPASNIIDENVATFGTNVLKVMGSGPNRDTRYTVRGGRLYSLSARTDNFGANVQCLDLVRNIPWEHCPQNIKDVVVHRATERAVTLWGRNPTTQQYSERAAAKAELTALRQPARPDPLNPNPVVLSSGPSQ
jgi:hypothetical protein